MIGCMFRLVIVAFVLVVLTLVFMLVASFIPLGEYHYEHFVAQTGVGRLGKYDYSSFVEHPNCSLHVNVDGTYDVDRSSSIVKYCTIGPYTLKVHAENFRPDATTLKLTSIEAVVQGEATRELLDEPVEFDFGGGETAKLNLPLAKLPFVERMILKIQFSVEDSESQDPEIIEIKFKAEVLDQTGTLHDALQGV